MNHTLEISDVCDEDGLKRVFFGIQKYLETQGPFEYRPRVIDNTLTWMKRGETFTVER